MTAMEAVKKTRSKPKMKDRIVAAMAILGINPNAVATLIQINHPSVYNWCNGKSEPNGSNLLKLASVLQVTPQYLLGLEEYAPVATIETHDNVVLLPLFPDTIKIMKRTIDSKETPIAMMPAMIKGGPNRFFMEMKDGSMTSHNGDISVPRGAYVLIDPDLPIQSGDYVAVRPIAGTRTLIRRYLVHGKNKWLEALDPAVERVKINAATIIVGKVTDIQIHLK